MITLYDLSAKEPTKTWSFNVWKVRYILNLKKLPYKTIYIEFADVASVLQAANFPPVPKYDQTLGYTLPSIIDDTTGATISDSFKIAEYLDTQYPETPKAFPLESVALQAAFCTQFDQRIISLIPLILSKVPGILNPVSVEYYHRKFCVGNLPGVPMGEDPEQLWKKAGGELFDWLEGLYKEAGGRFLMGEIVGPSFGDFVLGGLLEQMRILGYRDRIEGLNGGRWERLRVDLEKYASTEN